jgi:predicted dehydrogenase
MHVVLDKPLAPDAATAKGLADLASTRDRHLIPFQNRRWDSDFLTARAIAADGRIGSVHRFDSRIERMRVQPKPGWRGSADPADMGGMLYDLGAHVVDQALQLMGPVASVSASVRTVRPADATDDDVTLLLTHVSGAISLLVVSQIGAFGDPRMTLLGTRGGLRIDASDSQEAALAAGRNPSSTDWGTEPSGTEAVLRLYDDENQPTDQPIALEHGNWPAFYRGVEAAIRAGTPDPVLVTDAIATLRVLDAARESGATGQTVHLDPPAAHTPTPPR